MKYYIDTCIWLNLFKKEGDPSKGVPYWEIAERFIEEVISFGDKIYFSGIILKEIKNKLPEEKYEESIIYLKEKSLKINLIEDDYSFARKLESEWEYEIGFYDCIHVAVCKRLEMILVTRDKALIKEAKKYISVIRPEEL